MSEDELNKLEAVEDYRAHGLTSANGEHPFLMKAMQAVSIVAVEHWNQTALARAYPQTLNVQVESALRLPGVLLGALSTILIYLIALELFGPEAALIAAALWAFDPSAIGLNRIAKEDTFFLFFFLLANVFWLRTQRITEGQTGESPEPYYWLAAAAFGAMMASKYIPHFIAISISYNYVFQLLPDRRWQVGRRRYLVILAVMSAVFLLCNPTILLPGTWRRMLAFASYQRIGHDGYEFMGRLYLHKLTDWLRGVPWYFYFVFIISKLPPLTVAAFVVGLVRLFRKRTGDGRYFILFWMFFWGMAFIFPGGKFTRYFTTVMPAVIITAALGVQVAAREFKRLCARLLGSTRSTLYARVALTLVVIFAAATASLRAMPYYRLYTNSLAGSGRAGALFSHDEFYDAGVRQTVYEIASRARAGAHIATETPELAAFYAHKAGRTDLTFVQLSDASAIKKLEAGDFIMVARGRRYFSNDALISSLHQLREPDFRVSLGDVPAVDIYQVDQSIREEINRATGQNRLR